MPAILTNLLTGLLLFQAVSGWCCHRPCDVSGTCAATEVTSDDHHCCRKCEHETPAAPTDEPCQCDDCLGFCTYVAEKQVELDAADLFSLVVTLAIADHGLAFESPVAEGRYFAPGLQEAPPLRLHLLHQIMLI